MSGQEVLVSEGAGKDLGLFILSLYPNFIPLIDHNINAKVVLLYKFYILKKIFLKSITHD